MGILRSGDYIFSNGNVVFSFQESFNYSVITTLLTGLNRPNEISADFATNRLFVARYSANKVSVYNLTTFSFIIDITVPSNPTSVYADTVGNKLYISAKTSNKIHIFDLTTLAQISETAFGYSVKSLAVDATNNKMYVSEGNNVRVLNLSTFAEISIITGFSNNYGITIDAEYNRLIICNYGASNIKILNLTTYAEISTLTTGLVSPISAYIDSTNGRLIVCNYYSESLRIYRLSDLSFIRAITGVTNPYGVVYDPGNNRIIFSSESGTNSLHKIDVTYL